MTLHGARTHHTGKHQEGHNWNGHKPKIQSLERTQPTNYTTQQDIMWTGTQPKRGTRCKRTKPERAQPVMEYSFGNISLSHPHTSKTSAHVVRSANDQVAHAQTQGARTPFPVIRIKIV